MNLLKMVNIYDKKVIDNWENFIGSLNHLIRFHEYKVFNSKFYAIGSIDTINNMLPESAVEVLYNIPGTDMRIWEYKGSRVTVEFIATDRVRIENDGVMVTFNVKDEKESNDEN